MAIVHCSQCKYWQESQPGSDHGECRIHSPIAVIGMLVPKSIAATFGTDDKPMFEGVHPVTHADCWCGDGKK